MITPVQLDYFEQLPVFTDLAYTQPFECIEQLELGMKLFPDFVELIKTLRLATLQPGSPLYQDDESLTARWIAMLARSISEEGPHLDKLIPLTAQLLTEKIDDPLQIPFGPGCLIGHITQIWNRNSDARAWLVNIDDELDMMSDARNIDQIGVLYPDILASRLSSQLDSLDPAFVDLFNKAKNQDSELLKSYMPSLRGAVNLKALPYSHPIRMAVQGPAVEEQEYADRLKQLIDEFSCPIFKNPLHNEADARQKYIRQQVTEFKTLTDHMPGFSMDDLAVDLYAGFRHANTSSTQYPEIVRSFLHELGNIGVDTGSLAASSLKGSWRAGQMDARNTQLFVEKASSALTEARIDEKKLSVIFYREFLRQASDTVLLSCDLKDEAWGLLYRLKRSPAFLEKIQSDEHLESSLSRDMGL